MTPGKGHRSFHHWSDVLRALDPAASKQGSKFPIIKRFIGLPKNVIVLNNKFNVFSSAWKLSRSNGFYEIDPHILLTVENFWKSYFRKCPNYSKSKQKFSSAKKCADLFRSTQCAKINLKWINEYPIRQLRVY